MRLTQPWKGLVLFWLLPCVHSWKKTGKLYRAKALQVASCHLSFPASRAPFSVLSLAVLSRPLPLTPQCPSVLWTFDLCSRIPWRQYEDVEGVCGRTEWGNQENSRRGSGTPLARAPHVALLYTLTPGRLLLQESDLWHN